VKTMMRWWLRSARWRSGPHNLNRRLSYRLDLVMPDTSSRTEESTTGEIASIFQELAAAEKSTDVLEGRLSVLERRLDELLEKLESEQREQQNGEQREQQNGDSRSSS